VSQEELRNGDHPAELPLFTPRRIVQTIVVVILLLVGIYFLFPKLVGLGDALSKLDDADPVWIAIAIGFNVVAFATYIALFKAVVGGRALRLTWQAWPRPCSSRRPAPVGSCSRTGRSARRAWVAAMSAGGWSPS
jgi:hypothetical protein